MKAIVQEQNGDPSVLKIGEVEIPHANENEFLIKIEYSAVNRADCGQRKGAYPPPPGVTNVLGLECCGYLLNNISELQNEDYKNNKRVMALLSGGGYSQIAKVYKDHLIEIPDDLSFETAAAIPEVWLTAYQLLHFCSKVVKGETVLIHAAASGVGTSLIQLCNKVGAIPIAVSSTEEKLKVCSDLGAQFVINYKEEPDFSKKILEFTKGRGVDIILDPVGAQNVNYNIDSLALDGRWVNYGALGGTICEKFDLGKLMRKRAIFSFTTLRTRSNEYKTKLVQSFRDDCLQDFVEGKLKTIVDKIFNMSEVVKAHEFIESNQSIGKALLKNDL